MSSSSSSSNNNQVGKNIKHLRCVYGETLAELGEAVNLSAKAIENYESGIRTPDHYKLSAIAKHFGKTVDELLSSDLTDLPKMQMPVKGIRETVALSRIVVPLVKSDIAMNNVDFRKGYEKANKILNDAANNINAQSSTMVSIIDSFSKAVMEDDLAEAKANIIWCVWQLYWQIWSSVMNPTLVEDFSLLMFPRQGQPSDAKILLQIKEKENKSEEVLKKRQEFIAEKESGVIDLICQLKKTEEWYDLADYYLALKYLHGFVDSGLSPEMNQAVGKQMMLSLAQIKNKYAYRLLMSTMG